MHRCRQCGSGDGVFEYNTIIEEIGWSVTEQYCAPCFNRDVWVCTRVLIGVAAAAVLIVAYACVA